VQTGLKLYTNMICTSLRTSQDKDSSAALLFTAELREVIIVNTKIVAFTKTKAGATARQASPTADSGKQQAKEVTSAPAKGSLASKLKQATTGSK
jgi:hypothetical protein